MPLTGDKVQAERREDSQRTTPWGTEADRRLGQGPIRLVNVLIRGGALTLMRQFVILVGTVSPL